MPFIDLNSEHQVGVKMIDDQHAKLVDMINYLENAINTGGDIEEVKVLLNAIIGFAEYHFDEEERFMLRNDYPDYNSHSEVHDKLKWHLTEVKESLEKSDARLPETLAVFLRDWLLNHITELDSKLSVIQSRVTA